MKRRQSIAIALAAAALAFALLKAQQQDTRSVASLLPSGALLYLEAKDFGSLIKHWDSSTEKRKWLASANFGVLSRSRLVQRLGQAQDEFADVVGFSVAYNFVNEVAGDRSAFAFYDLANLKFVYLTRLDSTRLNNVELWRGRAKYEPREAAGIKFFVKSDSKTHRTVALASYRDWLVIATGEELMARTLTLLSGGTGNALATDAWFSDLIARSATTGDLRLAYNLDALLPTPQFRTYWLQQNSSELKQFKSGLSDLSDKPGEFEENRVLVRQEAASDTQPANLSGLLQYAPASASLYRAWSHPSHDLLTEQLTQVILSDNPNTQNSSSSAPVVSTSVADVGSSSDFDTRIDQPPFHREQSAALSQLTAVVENMHPLALLHVQTTVSLNDGVFVLPQSGVVIECEHPDTSAIENVLPAVTEITQTGSLDPLQVSASRNALIITRLPLKPSTTRTTVPPSATYIAVFDKKYEMPHYRRLFALLENRPPNETSDGIAPTFFGGNIGSLGETLARLDRVSITATEPSTELRETVTYTFNGNP